MGDSLPLDRLTAFVSDGPNPSPPTQLQLHLLRGWRDNTLLSYNTAVKKFVRFLAATNRTDWSLPASPSDIYEFCLWAGLSEAGPTGQDVSAVTLKKYLYGVQAWHTYHDLPYPHVSDARVTVLLRASGRQDALTPKKPLKAAVTLEHLLLLYHAWINGSPEEKSCLDCVIVAFWGMMRLAEVTYDRPTGKPDWLNSILYRDLIQHSPDSTSLVLQVRGAKTAKAGVSQSVLLNAQSNILCPVSAVTRRLALMAAPDDALFGYYQTEPVNLTRSRLVN